MSDKEWQPLAPDGSAAAANAEGCWLDQAADLIATDADGRVALWTAAALPMCFPRGWPAVFKESTPLKSLINKSMLKGVRCRAVSLTAAPTASAREAAAAAKVELHPLHSFSNASRLADALGWEVVKGFLVFERHDGTAAGGSFVALRHHWNVTADGAWVDLTPPLVAPAAGAEDRELLVESELGEKKPAALTPARREFALALSRRIAKGAESLAPPPSVTSPSVDVSDAAATAAPAASAPATSAPASVPSEAAIPAVDTQASAGSAAKSDSAAAAGGGGGSKAGSDGKHSKVDYSKWASLDVSDDEEDEQAASAQRVEQQEAMKKMAEQQQAQQAEAQGLNAAIQAAALASSVGNTEALDAMMDQAQAAAPLDPEMEAVLANLPEAARLAARASAMAQRSAADAAPPAKPGGKEPSLAELLKAQSISLDADEGDPGLEDMREFFETVDEAAAAEKALEAAAARARAATAAAAAQAQAARAAASASKGKPLDESNIQWDDKGWS